MKLENWMTGWMKGGVYITLNLGIIYLSFGSISNDLLKLCIILWRIFYCLLVFDIT